METEQALLQAVRGGDRQAMRRLYDRYVGYAMATGLRYIPDHDDVEDVVQDAFVKVLTAISAFSYRGEGSLKGWIGRIVANRALDVLRNRGRLRLVDDEGALADVPDGDDPDVDRMAPEVLMELIGKLPDGYRTVINLHVFEGLSHQEIGRQLGIKADSSASQFLRAKRQLAKMIREAQLR